MTTMTFDKLAYVDRLKAAGFAEPQARAMADGLDQALREEIATKSDVAALRSELDLFRVEVRSELGTIKNELGTLKGDLAALRGDVATKGDLVTFKGDVATKGDLATLRGELNGLKGELLVAMGANKVDILKWVMMLVVGQTAVFTALKLVGR